LKESAIFRSAVIAAIVASLLVLLGTTAEAKWYRCRHLVLPGESISEIAQRYRITSKRLRKINKIKKGYIQAGKKLGIVSRFPCRTRAKVRYKVKRGDNLTRIARKYKLSLRLLKRLNRGAKKILRPGQKIWVVVEGPRPGAGIKGLYQLSSGPGYKVRKASHSWGTLLAVTQIISVLTEHHKKYPRSHPLRVDDLSKEGGGHFPPHLSHRTGRDVDIRFPMKKYRDGYIRLSPRTLDVRRTWDLLHSFIKTGKVVYLFVDYRLQRPLYKRAQDKKVPPELLKQYFQYPRKKKSMYGIIRYEPGHATHVHVRFVRDGSDKKLAKKSARKPKQKPDKKKKPGAAPKQGQQPAPASQPRPVKQEGESIVKPAPASNEEMVLDRIPLLDKKQVPQKKPKPESMRAADEEPGLRVKRESEPKLKRRPHKEDKPATLRMRP